MISLSAKLYIVKERWIIVDWLEKIEMKMMRKIQGFER